MAELTDAGCVAFSHADAPLTDNQLLLRALQYAATFDFPVWLRPQDAALARGGVAHDGQVATRLGLPAIPVAAETVALVDDPVADARNRCARSPVPAVERRSGRTWCARPSNAVCAITCDVAIHHAHLSEIDIGYFDPNCNLTPPLQKPARPRRAARRTRRRHRRRPVFRPHAGRRRRQAAAVRRSRDRRHRRRTAAAADAQMGRRIEAAAGAGPRAHHHGPGARAGDRRRPHRAPARPPTSASSIRSATGKSARTR